MGYISSIHVKFNFDTLIYIPQGGIENTLMKLTANWEMLQQGQRNSTKGNRDLKQEKNVLRNLQTKINKNLTFPPTHPRKTAA